MMKFLSVLKRSMLPGLMALVLVAGTVSPASAITITPITPITPIDPGIIKPISLDYSYDVVNGAATITDYLGSGGDITIPSTLGGYPVTAIKNQAFAGTSSLTGVVIPDSVKKIGYMAFSNCGNLKSATLPNGLVTIEDELFYGCKSLTAITIPQSVATIESSAFYRTGITSLNLPKNVTNFTTDFYDVMDKLTAINVDSQNPVFTSLDGVLYSKNMVELLRYPEAKADVTFTIPNGVKYVQGNSFKNCSALQNLTVPSSVVYVINFVNCKNLKTVVFQGSSTLLGGWLFYQCPALANVTLPTALKAIPEHAFDGCSSLKSINLPTSVTTISNSAFKDCINLSSITLPSSLTQIDSATFYNCKALPEISIPSGVTLINNAAFSGCSNLTSVIIPSKVTTMGAFAFKNCSNLVDARFKGIAPKIGKELFANTASGFKIFYPAGAGGWTTPTWYGYPTQPYASLLDLPIIRLRQIPTFSIPKFTIGDSIDLKIPNIPIPSPTPAPDEVPDLLPPDVLPSPLIPLPQGTTEIKLYLGNSAYLVNGESKMMDASPLLMNNRILLPVRYVAEPLGAEPVWDPVDQKVTITLGSTVLELWVGKNIARVNGVEKMIDPNNPDVKPIIVPPGRTMLPLRFLGESLGCEVFWSQELSEAKLTKVQ